MKFIHLSDLHLGKRLNDFSLLDDQKYILAQIIEIVRAQKPDAVVIAGDVFDRAAPGTEAVSLLDDFLCALAAICPKSLIISGNHDSPERLAYGGRLFSKSGIYLSPVYDGTLSPVTVSDGITEVDFYLLPFIKPAQVRRFFPERSIESYTDAVSAALSGLPAAGRRSVLITHQFVTGATRCESEELSVGGSDNVDAAVFSGFDYVALGHLHGAQSVTKEIIRYCGTPLKYSFSEARQEKSVTVVSLEGDAPARIEAVALRPLHELRELRGSYMELTDRANYIATNTADYLRITLTDEEDVPDAAARLRVIYPNLMRLDYDNQRTRCASEISAAENVREKTPPELFGELYEKQNGAALSSEQQALTVSLMAEIWEGRL